MNRKNLRWSSLWQGFDPYNWRSFRQFSALPLERCILCLNAVERRPLCVACVGDLPWRERPLGGLWCRGVNTYAAFHYEFPISTLIWALKFGNNVGVGALLGELMSESRFSSTFHGFTVSAVPLSMHRKVFRSYNQSAVLASALAACLGLELDLGCLRRVRDTPQQRGLGKRARRANVQGAFEANAALKGRRLLLVDDVITTGATLLAARRSLIAAGASEVGLFACAAVS